MTSYESLTRATRSKETEVKPIYSEFADDMEWRELLEDFVALVPQRVASIRSAMDAADATGVRTTVHQLRGACGSYGFHTLTKPAALLESAIELDKCLSAHQTQIAEFIQMLECIAIGPEQESPSMQLKVGR